MSCQSNKCRRNNNYGYDDYNEYNNYDEYSGYKVPGTDKHIHLVCGATTVEDEHCHEFLFTTQIESPLI